MLSQPIQLSRATTGQLLDRAFRLYRNNFLLFLGIIAIVQIPTVAVQIMSALIQNEPTSDLVGIYSILTLIFSVITAVMSMFGTAAMAVAAAKRLFGEEVTIVSAYGAIGRRWLDLIGLLVVAFLLGVVAFLWLLVPIIGWFTGFGILMFLGSVIAPLSIYPLILEERNASIAWRRVWDMTRQHIWRAIGYTIILGILNAVIVSGPATLVAFLLPSGPVGTQSTLSILGQSLATLVFGIIYSPLQFLALFLFYVDLRVRDEAFDLSVQTATLTEDDNHSLALFAQAPRMEQKRLMGGDELLTFFLLSLAVGAIIFVFSLFAGGIGALFGEFLI